MKVQVREGSQERRVLIAMIVDDAVAAAVAAKWEPPGLFASRASNLIGEWCVRHYKKYKQAPGRLVESYFDQWSNAGKKDKDVTDQISRLLGALSGEYVRLKKASQTDFALDTAAQFFSKVKMETCMADVRAALEAGDFEEAEKSYNKFRAVEMGLGAGIDLFADEASVVKAFEMKSEPVIRYPDALGQFFGDSLERNGFISYEGPEKRGKTFWLLDTAVRAVQQKRRTVFIGAGDMSQEQMILRLASRLTRRPYDDEPYNYPVSLEPSGSGPAEVVLDERKADGVMTHAQAVRAFKKAGRKVEDDKALKLSCHATRTLSAAGIQGILADWERDDWRPDCIVIDYADIMAPMNGTADTRDQVNLTWAMLRSLSQIHHCLVVVATQTDADSYDTEIIEMDNFSEDKRKRAHVTGSVGLNQNDTEKENGIYRLNWVVRRERKFDRKKCVYTAGCLAVANPAILSVF